jgi:hypothetical protein
MHEEEREIGMEVKRLEKVAGEHKAVMASLFLLLQRCVGLTCVCDYRLRSTSAWVSSAPRRAGRRSCRAS